MWAKLKAGYEMTKVLADICSFRSIKAEHIWENDFNVYHNG